MSDIAWDSDNKRLLVVGDGKQRFGSFFVYDTGSSAGEVAGHSKRIITCDIRPTNPFRAITASEDFTVCVFHGLPLLFHRSLRDHTNFIHDVKYSPDGAYFATCGADRRIFLYDAIESDLICELLPGHSGSVFGLAWSPDNSLLLSVSHDATARVWNVRDRQCIHSIQLTLPQVGCTWTSHALVSVSAPFGDINYLDAEKGQVIKTLYGHNKAIVTAVISHGEKPTLFTGCRGGRILEWDAIEKTSSPVTLTLSKLGYPILSLALTSDRLLVSLSLDDAIRIYPLEKKEDGINNRTLPIDCGKGCKTMAILEVREANANTNANTNTNANANAEGDHRYIFVVKEKEMVILNAAAVVAKIPIKGTACAIAIHPRDNEIAIGTEEGFLRIYRFEAKDLSLSLKQELLLGQMAILCLSYSSSMGNEELPIFLAAGDGQHRIHLLNANNDYSSVVYPLSSHTARISSISWSPSGRFLVSCGLDTSLIVWDVNYGRGGNSSIATNVFRRSHLDCTNVALFSDETTVISCGQDAMIKSWSVA